MLGQTLEHSPEKEKDTCPRSVGIWTDLPTKSHRTLKEGDDDDEGDNGDDGGGDVDMWNMHISPKRCPQAFSVTKNKGRWVLKNCDAQATDSYNHFPLGIRIS